MIIRSFAACILSDIHSSHPDATPGCGEDCPRGDPAATHHQHYVVAVLDTYVFAGMEDIRTIGTVDLDNEESAFSAFYNMSRK